ncbi:NAD(P)-binding protein [Coniochaeta ligniaria NRRL 30616]|uniref:NAD(P)-binding protein n=1 Tax=Coniochaeta ligniaria NRRL 30616 TaxID=1408157 RepID=A0A1J7JE41_9PEZI|nr:NAD(P)-binding protein [Coniochaeta ligniaria NRRL 30616]
MSSPSEQTILVTGANGFIGGHVLKEALKKGYHVRALVRTEKSSQKFRTIFASYGDQLSWAYVPDIAVVENYASAFENPPKPITAIVHLASPFTMAVSDNKRDLLEPAVQGAVAILEAAKKYGSASLRRVVLTSSFASHVDLTQGYRPGYTYSEKDWNPQGWETAELDSATAYCASKKLAEKAAWDWIEANKPTFDLTTIEPPWVFGPHVDGVEDLKKLNQSSASLSQLLDAAEVPAVDFAGFVDVRDLGAAQILVLETPAAGGQRFLFGSHFDYQTAADILRENVPELKSRIPEGTPGAGLTQAVYAIDGSKAERVLGIKYMPLKDTLVDSFAEFVGAKKSAAVAA